MKRLLIFVLLIAFILPSAVYAAPAGSDSAVKIPNGPKFRISNVERGESVTLAISEFPAGKTYQVYLAAAGNHYSDGYKVGTLSDSRSNFRVTYDIPSQIRMQAYISVFIVNLSDATHGYDIFANDTGYDWREPLALTPVHRSSAQSAGKSCGLFQGPVFWVEENGYPDTFSLRFTDFYEEGRYTVYTGENNGLFQGFVAGFVTDTDGIQFRKTFPLASELRVEGMEIKIVVQNAFNGHSCTVAMRYQNPYNTSVTPFGYFTTGDFATDGSGSGYNSSVTPFTSILNVVTDGEVTLQTFNFPPDKDFLVTMGPMGTKGIGGYVVGTQNSGDGGSFIATYPIPTQLYGSDMISIRLESTSSGHFAYDYFTNSDGYSGTSGGTTIYTGTTTESGWVLPAGTHPYTTVISVVGGTSVTIQGTNFTTNDTYTVLMGAMGTQGVGGIAVASYNTGASSSFTATFNIPSSLVGNDQIAIRFESDNTPYYAYDWFNNITYP
jgi:hypothetical protein